MGRALVSRIVAVAFAVAAGGCDFILPDDLSSDFPPMIDSQPLPMMPPMSPCGMPQCPCPPFCPPGVDGGFPPIGDVGTSTPPDSGTMTSSTADAGFDMDADMIDVGTSTIGDAGTSTVADSG